MNNHNEPTQTIARPCGCLTCQDARRQTLPAGDPRRFPGMDAAFRFACEICGNKRCPHHSNHTLACTNSNAAGQAGSFYQ